MLSFESQPGGWDQLTEENAERCIDYLPELVDYLAQFTKRINVRTRHEGIASTSPQRARGKLYVRLKPFIWNITLAAYLVGESIYPK
jgi:hypothetical protein